MLLIVHLCMIGASFPDFSFLIDELQVCMKRADATFSESGLGGLEEVQVCISLCH